MLYRRESKTPYISVVTRPLNSYNTYPPHFELFSDENLNSRVAVYGLDPMEIYNYILEHDPGETVVSFHIHCVIVM